MCKKSKLAKVLECLEGLRFEVEPQAVMRPCLVDSDPAVFHRYVEADQALLRINVFCKPAEQAALVRRFRDEGVYDQTSCSVEVVRNVAALVEYPDGSMGRVDPVKLTFLDGKN